MRTGDELRRLLLTIIGVLFVAFASEGDVRAGARAYLVEDINRTAVDETDSFPAGFLTIGTKTFFQAKDGIHGRELWVTDGTEEGTKMFDLNPGEGGSLPYNLTEMGGVLYFTTRDQDTDCALWRSDGTEVGTRPVKVFGGSCTQIRDTLLYSLATVNGEIYFSRDDGIHGAELWKSDGTDAGTVLVRDIRPGGEGSRPGALTALDGKLFFFADDGTSGSEPWISDGSESGTMLVADIHPGNSGSGTLGLGNGHLVTLDGKVFFSANDGESGGEVWVSDGSNEGTQILRDFNPGPDGAFDEILNVGPQMWGPWFAVIVAVQDRVFFTTSAGTLQTGLDFQLWGSDGTPEGTVLVHDLPRLGFYPRDLTEVDGNIFFTATAEAGNGLWRSDGSDEGTFIVKESDVGKLQLSRELAELVNVGGVAYFIASDDTYGCEIWRSDGTLAGTYRVSNIHPSTMACYEGPVGATPYDLTANKGGLLFSASDGVHGTELFRSDGTEGGTVLVKDLNVGGRTESAFFNLMPSPWLVTINDTVLFWAYSDPDFESSLWRTDGTEKGTFPIPELAFKELAGGVAVGGVLLFQGYDADHGDELWATDGTVAGTRLVKDLFPGPESSSPAMLGRVENAVLFVASSVSGRALWRTDGTGDGTVEMHLLGPALDSSGASLARLDDVVVFVQGGQLWATDGTSGGTKLLLPTDSLGGAVSKLVKVEEFAVFAAGMDLWRTDGTAEGTELVTTIETASPDSFLTSFVSFADKFSFTVFERFNRTIWVSDGTSQGTLALTIAADGPVVTDSFIFFIGYEEETGLELWKSDGTSAGSGVVKDIRPGRASSFFRGPDIPPELTAVGNSVYFVVDDGIHGPELWTSDGTESGTRLVLDIDPRLPDEDTELHLMLSNVGGKLIFWPFDPEFGAEPWTTDGTESGTRIIQDIAPGALSSGINWEDARAIVAGPRVFFIADDSIHGRELWALPLSALGTGCFGDCDDNGVVTVDELVLGIEISLGNRSVTACSAFDADRRGEVTIDELILGVEKAIEGCGD